MKKVFLALALVAMTACASSGEGSSPRKDMCVQMYSARSILTHENYADLLKTIASMGYTAVETASYDAENGLIYGDTPEVFRKKVEAAGMKVLSAHVSRGLSREELERIARDEPAGWPKLELNVSSVWDKNCVISVRESPNCVQNVEGFENLRTTGSVARSVTPS